MMRWGLLVFALAGALSACGGDSNSLGERHPPDHPVCVAVSAEDRLQSVILPAIASRANWQVSQAGVSCSPNVYITGTYTPVTQGFRTLGYIAVIHIYEPENDGFWTSALASNDSMRVVGEALDEALRQYENEHSSGGKYRPGAANVASEFLARGRQCMKVSVKDLQSSLVSDRLAEAHGWSRVSDGAACEKVSGGPVTLMNVMHLDVPDASGRAFGVAVASVTISPRVPYRFIANISFDALLRPTLNATIDGAARSFDSSFGRP
jgi:hypothetical protein